MIKHNFRKLRIWKESLKLVFETYKLTKTFPVDERFGLTRQLNKCSILTPSNIAKGSSKSSNKHFKTFLETSLGSVLNGKLRY